MCVGVWYSFFLHVTSGERRLRRRSANILLPTSDERSLAGGGAESYRCPPVGGSPPELAIAPAALLRLAEAAHILIVDNKKAAAISSRDSHCLHLLRSIKHALSQTRSDSQTPLPFRNLLPSTKEVNGSRLLQRTGD